MVEIGQDVSEQLDIVPMQVRVLRHIRKRYGGPKGDQAPVSTRAPAQVLPKSNASNDLLALLIIIKYVDGLPLARFEHVLARSGVLVPRQPLARWVIGTARALQPVANLMRDVLLGHDVIHMDETPIQVLKEPGRSPTSMSQMWVQRGGPAAVMREGGDSERRIVRIGRAKQIGLDEVLARSLPAVALDLAEVWAFDDAGVVHRASARCRPQLSGCGGTRSQCAGGAGARAVLLEHRSVLQGTGAAVADADRAPRPGGRRSALPPAPGGVAVAGASGKTGRWEHCVDKPRVVR